MSVVPNEADGYSDDSGEEELVERWCGRLANVW